MFAGEDPLLQSSSIYFHVEFDAYGGRGEAISNCNENKEHSDQKSISQEEVCHRHGYELLVHCIAAGACTEVGISSPTQHLSAEGEAG